MKSLMVILGAIVLGAALLLTAGALGATWLRSSFTAPHGPNAAEAPIPTGPVAPSGTVAAQPIAPSPGGGAPIADKPAGDSVWTAAYVKDGVQDGVTLELTGLTRTDDGLLKASFRIRNATDKPVTIWSDLGRPYYVDPTTKVVYGMMCNCKGKIVPMDKCNGAGEPIASHSVAWIKAPANDVSRTYWAKLQGPDDGVQKVAFYFRDFEPIEGVALPPAKN